MRSDRISVGELTEMACTAAAMRDRTKHPALRAELGALANELRTMAIEEGVDPRMLVPAPREVS